MLNGGIQPGRLYIIAARPSVGKSSFAQFVTMVLAALVVDLLFLFIFLAVIASKFVIAVAIAVGVAALAGYLVFGLAPCPFQANLVLTLECVTVHIVEGIVGHRQALHGRVDTHGGAMLAHPPHRARASRAPGLQVAGIGDAQMGGHLVRGAQGPFHLRLDQPAVCIRSHPGGQDVITQIQRSAFGPRVGVKVKSQL